MGRVVAGLVLFVFAVVGSGVRGATAQQSNAEALYQEARRLFDSLEYDKAVVALDEAIAAFQAAPAGDATRRDRLATAYEMRARSKYGLGDQDGARADFVSLLQLSPGYVLSGQVSPRVVALFEEVVRKTVTNLTVALTPATASLTLDGAPLAGPGTVRVAVGEHVISADQPGYRPVKETVNAVAETTAEVTLTLERVSSVIRVVTVPADVEVKVDGTVVGRTAAPSEAAAGDPPPASAPLVVSDVANGQHTVELRRDCYVTVTQRVEIERPDDYSVGPVTLRPAVATLAVTANHPNTQVFLDGRERGVAPLKIADVCEGQHLVELRSRFGSDSRRIDVRADAEIAVEGMLRPTFAIVSASGPSTAQQDLRLIVERALSASSTIKFVAPPADQTDKALKDTRLSPDWLATDPGGRPIGASAQLSGAIRHDLSLKLSESFRTQGVASVTAIEGSRVVVALLGAGSGVPDVLEVALDDPSSVSAAIARLDRGLTLLGSSVGVRAIDVADVAGPVIVAVDPNGPAAGKSLQAGDVVVQVDGQPVADVAALTQLVAKHRPGDAVAMDLRDAASGAAKRVDLKVVATPRVIGLSESGVLANRLLLDLRSRLESVDDALEESVVRLNMAVALARLDDWRAAREELQRVKLADTSGVGSGTVQYLLGLAAEKTGSRAEAETAFRAAAASDNLLTEFGPPIRVLAEARLAELSKAPR